MKNLYTHIKKSINDRCFPAENSEVKIDVRGLDISANFTEVEVRSALTQICQEMGVKGIDGTFYIWFSFNWNGYVKLSREKQPRMIYTYNNSYEVYGMCFEYQRPHGWEDFEMAKKMADNIKGHRNDCKPEKYNNTYVVVIAGFVTVLYVATIILILILKSAYS